MRLLMLILFLINESDCKSEIAMQVMCNKEQAGILTDEEMKKNGYDVKKELAVTIKEDSTYFYIESLPDDSMRLGGGAEFKVAKSDCAIKEKKLYQ